MRSLGRALRSLGKRDVDGSRGRRTEMLFSSHRLPFLASAARLVRRIGLERLPQRMGVYASGAFLAMWVAYGVVLGGHVSSVGSVTAGAVGYVAAQLGFGVEEVRISGHNETGESEILSALELGPTASLVTLDPYRAQQRLELIDWVRSATVKKLFPGTVEIDIVEREPYALWQIGGIVSLIDRHGSTIGLLQHRRHARLPMVVGYGANRAAGALIELVAEHPRLAGRVRAAVRVAERRWNLRLDNGIEIRLPEDDPSAALAELVRLDTEEGLLARDIVAVDMRLSDRLVVRLSESGVERRRPETASRSSQTRGSDT